MSNKKTTLDILPLNTIVEVVKLDLNGEFVGKMDMEFGKWKDFKKQPKFIYRCFQKKFSQFHLN